jgi:Rap1a immunity proteins
MKITQWIKSVITMIFAVSVPAFAAGGYGNARDLQTDCAASLKFMHMQANVPEMYATGYCYGFLSGVADILAQDLPTIEKVSPEDLAHVVLTYFAKHPDVLQLHAGTAVRMAFREKYGERRTTER